MIRPKSLFLDGKCANQQAFSFRNSALSRENKCKVIEAGGDIGMIGPQCFFPDDQGTPRQLLGLLKPPLLTPELSKIVECCRQIKTITAMPLFLKAKRFKKP